MERARHRKSRSASGIEGIRQIHKQNVPSRLSSDSHSYFAGGTRDDMLTLDLGKSSLKRASGTPMKKLLAEEMSKEVEPRRRSPSVIARLMGLEGLPSPRHVRRQQNKRFSDIHQHKNASLNVHPDSQIYDVQSNRRRSIEQHEFKDVYEDLEASHVMNRRCSSRWSASSILTKPEMALLHNKFIDAKRLSTDEKHQDSTELDDTMELLDSNKDLLLKLFRKPDSLFSKHLHGVQTDPAPSLGSRIAVLKPSNSLEAVDKNQAWKSERDVSRKYDETSHLKRKDGLLLEGHNHHRVHSPCRSSKIHLDEKNEEKIHPTRIVVLKPNLGKAGNDGVSGYSPDRSCLYQPNFEKMEHVYDVGAETVSCRRNDASYGVGLVKPMSKEAREIARNITRRMKDTCDDSLDVKSITGFRGYAGDESSFDENESDLDSDLEVFKLSSRKSYSDSKLHRCSSSSSVESLVYREGKKRLSERWNMTQRYQDLEIVGKGSTLGEMLALPDRETRIKFFDNKINLGRASSRPSGNPGNSVRGSPSGISSSEGWKDVNERTSSRSRSKSLVPNIDGRSHRRSTYHDELPEEKKCVRSNSIRRGRSKVPKENLSHKEDISAKNSKYRSKKPLPCPHISINESGSSLETNFQIQMKERVDLYEEQPRFQMVVKDEICDSPVHDVMMVAEHGSTTLSPRSSVLLPKNLSPVVDGERSAAPGQKHSSIQELPAAKVSPSFRCFGAEPDSSESSKEADNPSPVSVLGGVPFTEDTSSTESFERVSAGLHELRMQLQLLKMESGTDPELSSLAPIDEEVAQLSPVFSEGNYNPEGEAWEISYAVDLLICSGFEESGFNMFRTKWHSPSSSLDPKLFENLENKYNDETTVVSRSDRKLLFDRINSSLVEIFEEHVDSCPWVMPKLSGSQSTLHKDCVVDAIENLIEQGFAEEEITERGLDKEMQWSFTKGEIDVIGMEMEELLIDDMIIEVLSFIICN